MTTCVFNIPRLLQGIASSANGTYYFIESAENIPETFADALGGLLSVFAQNVELTITPLATNTVREVHTGQTKRSNGTSTVVALPDVFAEERKDIVVDLLLPAVPLEGSTDTLKATVSYINVVSGQMVTGEVVLALQRAERVPEGMTAAEEVVMHRTRLSVANRLQQAVQLADTGRYEEADSVLAEQEAALDNLVVLVWLLINSCALSLKSTQTILTTPNLNQPLQGFAINLFLQHV